MSREKPVVSATLTPETRSAAIASGTPTMGDGGLATYAAWSSARNSAYSSSTVSPAGGVPDDSVMSPLIASRLSAPIQRWSASEPTG